MTPIQTIEACVEHWRENVRLFRGDQPKAYDQWVWFNEHCLSNRCPACTKWGENHLCPLAAPDKCNDGANCCDVEWRKARNAATKGQLAVSHLEAVLAYIEKVLAKMKEESR